MKLTLTGHDDRYAVEQLQMALFPDTASGEALSSLHRGEIWLTAVTKITVDGKSATGIRRLKAAEESVRLRRRILQQSYYAAAVQLPDAVPAWGALAGVRPTKISTKHILYLLLHCRSRKLCRASDKELHQAHSFRRHTQKCRQAAEGCVLCHPRTAGVGH